EALMSGKSANGLAKGSGKSADLRRTEGDAAGAVSRPEQIRNVVLVGHSGAGKTMLAEAMLVATGATNRMGSILEGTTVSDSDPSEIHQQRSVVLSVLPFMYDDVKINLFDTPGYSDFTGELRAGLRAADAALFVVSAVDGIDAATIALWEECSSIGMPRAVTISRLDHPRANFDAALANCRAVFGESVQPLYLPVRSGTELSGLHGLLSGTVSEYQAGERQPVVRPAD